MITRFGDGRDWFFEKRFGLFIHWGLYAIPAWHEQVQYSRRIPRKEYEQLMHQFNPVRFDPGKWLDLVEEAGMEYVCFTTKHLDGFCLWNTARHDYNVMHTPYGKDILKMLAEACHRRNIPLCLYYSVVDIHHPNYPNQNRSYELSGPEAGDDPDPGKYAQVLKAQVKELCTQYGEIRGFWWDANVMKLQDTSINEMIRSLQPKAVINDRGPGAGDFSTPERDWYGHVNEVLAFDKPTEACQSIGMESWGYKEDEDYYTERYLMQSMDNILVKGGNYLLNVGPMADGTLPSKAVEILRGIGKWYHAVRESFAGCKPVSHLTENRDVLLSWKRNRLYVHLLKPLIGNRVLLKPIVALPRRSTLLNTGENVEARVDLLPLQGPGQAYLRIRNLPVSISEKEVLVIKLEFDEGDGFVQTARSMEQGRPG